MIVICDECNKKFSLKQEDLQEKYLGAMYTEIYYNCKRCGHKYLIGVKNSKCRKLEYKLKNKSLEALKGKDVKEELEKIQKSHKREMDRINGR